MMSDNDYIDNSDKLFNLSNENRIQNSLKLISDKYLDYIDYIRKKNQQTETGRLNLDDYPEDYKKLFYFIRFGFPKILLDIIGDENKFYFNGSKNISGNPPFIPWASISLYENNEEGYYIAYLFNADLSGVYLCLMLAVTQYNNKKNKLNQDKNNFNKLLNYFHDKTNSNLNLNNFNDSISLNCKNKWPKGNCSRSNDYEAGTIFCKYYSLDSALPEENILKNDLLDCVKLYEFAEDNKIFDKISDKEYSFEREVAAFQLVESIMTTKNLLLNQISPIIFEDEKNNLKKHWDDFSKSVSSLRDKYKFKNNFIFNEQKIQLNFGYNRVLNDLNQGFYIFSNIDFKNNQIDFGLSQNAELFKSDVCDSCLNYIYERLCDKYKNSNFNFDLRNNSIISNQLNLDSLNQLNFLNYFENLIDYYENSISDYICYMFNKLILNKNLGDDLNFSEFQQDVNLDPEMVYDDLGEFIIDKKYIYKICSALNSGKNIILNGAPGTGKSELAKFISNKAKGKFISDYLLTTATSDWSTFDTIGGWMPDNDNGGSLKFHEGVFLEAIKYNKWLIIDEINRADIDKAFGQLFTILSGNIDEIELPYVTQENKSIFIKRWDKHYSTISQDGSIYYIGKNWRIIGTMNDEDKDSLFDLSYAFMRRFMFINVDVPDGEQLHELMYKWFEDFRDKEEFTIKLVKIFEIKSNPKDLGPGIFKDMVDYIKIRKKCDAEEKNNEILNEVIESYIVPQLEGLSDDEIGEVIKEFDNLDFDEEYDDFKLDGHVKRRLEQFKLVKHEGI